MANMSLGEKFRQFIISMRVFTFWLEVQRDTPRSWFSGGYSRIKFARFSLVVLALFDYSGLALGTSSFSAATLSNLWYGLAAAGYIIVAAVYLFGLRMWYAPAVTFVIISALINMAINFAGGPLGLGAGASSLFSLIVNVTWLYMVVAGLMIMRYDKGSKVNDLLLQS